MPLAMLKFAAQEHGAGHFMRFLVSAVAWLATLAIADAEPMLTISCDKPTGFNIAYGRTSLKERLEALEKKQPEPPPALTVPNQDGYLGKLTFIIDSNRKKITVIWAQLPQDVQ